MGRMFNKKRGCDAEERIAPTVVNRLESQKHNKAVMICDSEIC